MRLDPKVAPEPVDSALADVTRPDADGAVLSVRLLVSATIAIGAVGVFWIGSRSPGFRADFDQLWYAARAVLDGHTPHEYVGPGRRFDYGGPLYYPMPAVLVTVPLALLPLTAARLVFAGVSTFLLALATSRRGCHQLPIFLSGSFLMALATAQWEVLFTASLVFPALGLLAAAKPNMGLIVGAGSSSGRFIRFAVLGGLVLTGLSFAVWPGWMADWFRTLTLYPRIRPLITHLGGPLVLLCLLRWRRPEARLLIALAVVPHTTLVYAALPVMLVARRLHESILLAALSLVVLGYQRSIDPRGGGAAGGADAFATFAQFAGDVGQVMVLLLLLPATALVLARKNEAAAL